MSAVQLSFVLRADDSVVLTVKRTDGTVTWQKHEGANARFFPFHDLTHFAVETELGARDGFYGLLAAGWDFADIGGKGERGPLPPEAILVEHLVGLFERERMGGASPLSPDEFSANLELLASAGQINRPPAFTTEQLDRVRRRIAELHDTWAASASSHEPLVLEFVQPPSSRLMSS